MDWLFRVNSQFSFQFDTWVLTASLLDRFLSAQPIEKDVFHLNLGIDTPHSISLWKINNPNSRDFRIWEVGRNWKKIDIKGDKSGKYKITAPMSDGYTASLIEVIFYPNSESPITLTTGTHILPDKYSFSSYKSKIKKE